MYLSRLVLNPRDRRVRRDLSDCQELHRTLLSAWPDFDAARGARARCGLLYRVDTDDRRDRVRILVQSADPPMWDRLPATYVLDHETKPLHAVYAALQPGMRLRFRLRANPTKRLKRPGVSPEAQRLVCKRVDLRREEDQVAWLERKGREQCGFRITHVQVSPEVPNLRTQPEPLLQGQRGDDHLTFRSVLFEGELEVTDVERFRQALAGGIGSGKAYGFGLLSIAPVKG